MTGTFYTQDGGTIEVHRVGLVIDFHVKNRLGHTVATHEVPEDEARGLLLALHVELDSPAGGWPIAGGEAA